MSIMGSLQWLCLFLFLFNFEATNSESISSISSSVQWCPHEESLALLQFAKSFSINASVTGLCYDHIPTNAYPKTKSWKEGGNCCSWDGVTCDLNTGHVIGLDLSCSMLQGNFPSKSTLFSLSRLQKLVLSNNDFNKFKISPNFSRFLNLTHLDLSLSNFSGRVPLDISRLSKLVFLDLSQNFFLRVEESTFDMLVQNLTDLEELNLNLIDMSLVHPSSLMNLSTSLSSLHLQFCEMKGELHHDIFHRSALESLDLMGNGNVDGYFALFNVSAFRYLDLSWTKISVSLDNDFASNLKFLKVLNLRRCNLVKSNLGLLGNLTHLTELDLSENYLSGQIPSSFANLINLTRFDISTNNYSGPIPSFLGNLTQITFLHVSNNNFVGKIPFDFANLTQLYDLDLSNNHLIGSLPFQLGLLPILTGLDVSNNLLEGTVQFSLFGENVGRFLYSSLWSINLSNNNLHGPIPSSICKLKSLRILDLSNNILTSSLPQCLGNFRADLSVLRLNGNKFQGTILLTFSERNSLQYINLYGNEFEGIIPPSIINCTKLEVLDLGNNKIEDTFPYFLWTLPMLKVLAIRSNKLHGSIMLPNRTPNFSFSKLQILDLSNNTLSGNLPVEFFSNMKAMIATDQDMGHNYLSTNNFPFDFFFDYSIEMTSKRLQIILAHIQTILVIIDLSCNRFTGNIPEAIGKLQSLIELNISNNCLEDSIPPSLGNLSNLESLDLSSNLLSGRIPEELVELTFLEVLDLSYNQLEGTIPQGKQFNTFESGSYEGNPGLCGSPLLKLCSNDKRQQPSPFHEESTYGFGWKIVLVGYLCGLIFGLAIGQIVFKTRKPLWIIRMVESG